MGTTPTRSWRKGDASRHNVSRPDTGWCLQPAPPGDDALFAHVEAVVALLRDRVAIVRALSDAYGADIVCVGAYDQATRPGLYLVRGMIADMAAMGLGLDADLYVAADGD